MSNILIENGVLRGLGEEPQIWEKGQFEAMEDLLGVVSGGRQAEVIGYLERKFPNVTNVSSTAFFNFQEEKGDLFLHIGEVNKICLNLTPRRRSGREVVEALDLILQKALVDAKITEQQVNEVLDESMATVHRIFNGDIENSSIPDGRRHAVKMPDNRIRGGGFPRK